MLLETSSQIYCTGAEERCCFAVDAQYAGQNIS